MEERRGLRRGHGLNVRGERGGEEGGEFGDGGAEAGAILRRDVDWDVENFGWEEGVGLVKDVVLGGRGRSGRFYLL